MTDMDRPDLVEVIRDACNVHDELHALIPTERDGSDLFVLTVRVQEAERGDGDVVHVRTILVDTDAETAEWQGNGMWLPVTSNLPLALGKSLIATHNLLQSGERSRDDVLIKNGLDAGGDDLAELLLGVADDEAEESATSAERPPMGREGSWSEWDDVDAGAPAGDADGAESSTPTTRTCDDCGATRTVDETVELDLGGVTYIRCRGDHEGEDDGTE